MFSAVSGATIKLADVREFASIEIDPSNNPVCIHIVKTSSQNHCRSMMGFKYKEMTRRWEGPGWASRPGMRWFQTLHLDHFKERRATDAFILGEDEFQNIPTCHYDDVLVFYAAIGWDRKRGRFRP